MRLFFLLFVCIGFSQNKQSFYFDFNESSFNVAQENDFQNWLTTNENIEIIKIEGYCDSIGNNNYNFKLAQSRIDFVLALLKRKKIDTKKIIQKSYGENFLQDSLQDTNRRVDIFYKILLQKEENLTIKPEIGEVIVLKNLNFYNNSGTVLPESKPVLEKLLATMKKYPSLKIEIQGHICCQTEKQAEKIIDIAKIRALSVYDYLLENGINKERMRYVSFKSSKPLFPIPEKTEAERKANRRVEILILEN